MVTETHKPDRGQLVLIGAISLAFILLGVVIVFNSVQYTETIDSGGASDDISEIRTIESEIRTNLETVSENRASVSETTVKNHINNIYAPQQTAEGPINVVYADNWNDSNPSSVTFDVTITTPEMTVTKELEVDLS